MPFASGIPGPGARAAFVPKRQLVHAEHPQGAAPEKWMKLVTLLVVATALAVSPKALASEGKPLQLKLPKAALAASAPNYSNAPFAMPIGGEPELALIPRNDLRQEQSRSSCSSESALCYDAASGRIVYKPARNLMPDLPGFTRENISVKRDRIVFRYSF
ncbi:MAG TPA: hypothetical protein VM051_12725 [Usitatibacter sp.]|nr:hypothetical protein [Usitatibacter sp.]